MWFTLLKMILPVALKIVGSVLEKEAKTKESARVARNDYLKMVSYFQKGKNISAEVGNDISDLDAELNQKLEEYKANMSNVLCKQGDTGEKVTKVQELLKKRGYNLKIDGVYGPTTAKWVRDVQIKHSLVITGAVDEKTYNVLIS